MKLSTKGRYGLRALIDLAIHANGSHIPLSTIAERQKISEIYLEQVFATLRKAGIVQSVKGAQGGYLLTEDPRNIKVGTILRALEGDLSVLDDQARTEIKDESSISYCIKLMIWDKIDENVNQLVDTLTLDALVEEHKKINSMFSPMFYI